MSPKGAACLWAPERLVGGRDARPASAAVGSCERRKPTGRNYFGRTAYDPAIPRHGHSGDIGTSIWIFPRRSIQTLLFVRASNKAASSRWVWPSAIARSRRFAATPFVLLEVFANLGVNPHYRPRSAWDSKSNRTSFGIRR